MIYELPKYPRTLHIEGSKGIVDKNSVPYPKCAETTFVIEEKVDGSCVSIGFCNGEMYIHHRNTPAIGPEFDLLKRFLKTNEEELYCILDERYIMYGEWMYAKHTIFYDALPSYFLEYDVYDRDTNWFLTTNCRMRMFQNSVITSVNKKLAGSNPKFQTYDGEPSVYVSRNLKANFETIIDAADQIPYTDLSGFAEGLYLKEENEHRIIARYKLIRGSFVNKIIESGHWAKRKLVQNQLDESCRDEWARLVSGVGRLRS